jgi:hypothetical protein
MYPETIELFLKSKLNRGDKLCWYQLNYTV